jgi:hypothetical protein
VTPFKNFVSCCQLSFHPRSVPTYHEQLGQWAHLSSQSQRTRCQSEKGTDSRGRKSRSCRESKSEYSGYEATMTPFYEPPETNIRYLNSVFSVANFKTTFFYFGYNHKMHRKVSKITAEFLKILYNFARKVLSKFSVLLYSMDECLRYLLHTLYVGNIQLVEYKNNLLLFFRKQIYNATSTYER